MGSVADSVVAKVDIISESSKKNAKFLSVFLYFALLFEWFVLFSPSDHPNTYFVKQVEWNSDEYQRHQVGWGDDGGNKHNNEEGVFAVFYYKNLGERLRSGPLFLWNPHHFALLSDSNIKLHFSICFITLEIIFHFDIHYYTYYDMLL